MLSYRALTRTTLAPLLSLLAWLAPSGASAQDVDFGGGIFGKPPAVTRAPAPTRQQKAVQKQAPKAGSKRGPRSNAKTDPAVHTPHAPSEEAMRHYDLGKSAYDRNELEKAVAEYETAIKLDPRYPDALIDLGAALYDLSDLDAALDAWKRALFLDKSIPELHHNIANVSYVRGDFESALAEYQEAVRLRPIYSDALFGLGNTLMALKRFDEAISYFEKAIASRGTPFAEARSNMAWAMLRAGHLADAEASAREAIDEIGADSTQSVKAWYSLAAVLTEKKDYTGGATALERAIAVCAGCATDQISKMYYSLASVREAKGDRSGAAAALDEYLRLAPYVTNADDVRRRIERLRSS